MALTPEYQSLHFTNHIKSCPTYWHHILIFTQVLTSIISIRRHHRGHFTIYIVNSQYPLTLQNTSVRSEISCPTQSATRPPTPVRPAETCRAAPIRGLPRETWLSASSHRPTRYHDNTSAHDIYTTNPIIWCKSIILSDIIRYNPYLLQS